MTNKTETPPQAERRAYLAEHYMGAECDDITHSYGDREECPVCHGSGRRYLLRRECDKCRGYGTVDLDYGQASFYIGCSSCGGHQSPQVPNRNDVSDQDKGLGYVYDDSPNALTEAIRAKGWTHQIHSRPFWRGDSIGIFKWEGDLEHVRGELVELGRVEPVEGFRDTEALEIALYRACRAEAGE